MAGRKACRLGPAAAVGLEGEAERDTGSNGCLATLVAGAFGFAVSTDIPWTGVAMLATNGAAAAAAVEGVAAAADAAVVWVPPVFLPSPVVSMALRLATTFRADV